MLVSTTPHISFCKKNLAFRSKTLLILLQTHILMTTTKCKQTELGAVTRSTTTQPAVLQRTKGQRKDS